MIVIIIMLLLIQAKLLDRNTARPLEKNSIFLAVFFFLFPRYLFFLMSTIGKSTSLKSRINIFQLIKIDMKLLQWVYYRKNTKQND